MDAAKLYDKNSSINKFVTVSHNDSISLKRKKKKKKNK